MNFNLCMDLCLIDHPFWMGYDAYLDCCGWEDMV